MGVGVEWGDILKLTRFEKEPEEGVEKQNKTQAYKIFHKDKKKSDVFRRKKNFTQYH